MSYAKGTSVSAGQTQIEVLALLAKHGSQRVGTMMDDKSYSLVFEMAGVPYRMTMPLASRSDPQFTQYKRGSSTHLRSESAAAELYEKEMNRRWRAFGAVIKAKLIAVEEGITTIEAEFIGNAILKGGRTVAETYAQDLPALASTGNLSQLSLPGQH